MSNLRLEQAGHAQKAPYEPPKATFVPLKLEERLLACNWSGSLGPPAVCSKSGMS